MDYESILSPRPFKWQHSVRYNSPYNQDNPHLAHMAMSSRSINSFEYNAMYSWCSENLSSRSWMGFYYQDFFLFEFENDLMMFAIMFP